MTDSHVRVDDGSSSHDLPLLAAASTEFARVVRQLPADSWELPTPCEIPVRELVQHVVVGNRLTALLVTGVPRDAARRSVAGDQLGDDPLGAVADSARRQAQAFTVTPPERAVAGPDGDVTAAAYFRFRVVDLVVHAWDLLRAAGLDETLDLELVTAVWQLVEPHLDDMRAFGAYGCGPSRTLSGTASPQTRLLDEFGRRP